MADPLCEPLNWVIREGGTSVVLKAEWVEEEPLPDSYAHPLRGGLVLGATCLALPLTALCQSPMGCAGRGKGWGCYGLLSLCREEGDMEEGGELSAQGRISTL